MCYSSNILSIITSKVFRMSAAILLSLATSCSWGLIVLDTLPTDYKWYILYFLFSVVFGFVNLIFIWNDSLMDRVKQTVKNGEVQYTIDTLIGQRGVIVNVLGDKKYLGTLFDDANTEILVEIDEYNSKKNTFVIDRIENDTIYAKMSD